MKRLLVNTATVLSFIICWGISSCSRDSTKPEDTPPPQEPSDIEWIKTKGPNSGPVLSLAIDTLLNHVFAGTEGGVFKSTDNGETWIPFNNGLGGNVVYELAVDRNSRVYAALSQGGIFRSELNADNWVSISPRDTTAWAVALNSAGHIFAGTSAGLYRSTDDGANWEEKNSGLPGAVILSLSINSVGHIYAGTNMAGVFRSTDGGDIWAPTALVIGAILAIELNSDDDVFAGMLTGIPGQGIRFSWDNGVVWRLPDGGFTPSIVYDVAVNSDDFVFAGGDGDGVLRSIDEGVNWETKNSGLTSTIIYSLALDKDERLYAGSDSGYVYYTFNPTTIPPIDPGGN